MGKKKHGGGGKKPKRPRHSSTNHSIHSSKSQSSLSRIFNLTTKDKGPATYLICILLLIFLFSSFFIFLDPIRRQLGFSSSSDIDPSKLRGYRTRLRKLYEKYNPDKLSEIDDILLKWRGKEKELFKILHHKYVKKNKEQKEKERKERKERKKKEKKKDKKERIEKKKKKKEEMEKDMIIMDMKYQIIIMKHQKKHLQEEEKKKKEIEKKEKKKEKDIMMIGMKMKMDIMMMILIY